MFIKSIILDGFKSYGHRTEITGFDKQFNAVTGLNGSGKSNVLDAICFVLGITNLSQVRANNLQDLIFKSGQCGINKATVTITFDNTNPDQCPAGFEGMSEITITRQIILGGKNKYLINGSTVPNKRVQDLFCSVQLNVNNPHFLIMQGKITKVLNMKPYDILAMIEEAAGTKMYEVKKQTAQKTIEKKDAKLNELKGVVNEEITPKLEKLRAERAKFMEFKNLERELEHLMRIFHGWEYISSQKKVTQAKKALENEENKLKEVEMNLNSHKEEITNLEEEIENMTKTIDYEGNESFKKLEAELKEYEKSQAKANAQLKSIKDNINTETKKKDQLEKNADDDAKTLGQKEHELEKLQSLFSELKERDQKDNEALTAAQKRYEALSAGMELSESGEAETLLNQLMNARKEATKANTEQKQALLKLNFCESQLKEKQSQRKSNANELSQDQAKLHETETAIAKLEKHVENLKFDENQLKDLNQAQQQIQKDVRSLRGNIDNFEAQRPYTQFRYRDPEPNFDRKRVHGVVCRLIKVKNDQITTAVETAAGGRLYNVVVDTDTTGKALLRGGNLQQRITFIPLNKLQAHKMSDSVVKLAQDLVGKENVQPAISHLIYDKKLQVVMEFIFGNIFICKDINVARQVAFHDRIKRRCVTLDGDVVDPAGTLTGGAPQKGGSVLKQLINIQQYEKELVSKEDELRKLENSIREMNTKKNNYDRLKQQLEINQHEKWIISQRLCQSSHYKHQEEVNNLKTEIEQLRDKIKACKENERNFNEKVKELEARVNNSESSKEEQIKQAENEMKRLKAKADKSRKDWKQREQDYETYNLEIQELRQGVENTQQQIKLTLETIQKLEDEYKELSENTQGLNENVTKLQAEIKKEKGKLADKNKEIQRKIRKKEELQGQLTDFQIKIKETVHTIKKLNNDYKQLKMQQAESEKKIKGINLKEAENLTEEEGRNLEMKIRRTQEAKNSLCRTINNKAQTLFEQQEKEYVELKKKQKIVEQDKEKIMGFIKDLDNKKENILRKAYGQISKDFGSIFSTLLPGAYAKLLPPTGQTILQGLEVKVSLGGVWKENLTELSGGQRSLAALSFILAMLLFKPAPLYILDEVDAALDLSHTQNIGNMLKTHFKKSQFIVVSLKDGMFSNANVLFRTQFVDGVSTITRTVNKKHN